MSNEQDEEVIAAHAYRDGKIFRTFLIQPNPNGGWDIQQDDGFVILKGAPTVEQAQELGNMYMRGFVEGYDEGIEHASKERTKHDRTSADKRTAQRNLRVSGRGPAFESERRDRAHDQGTSQG
jgi:hypothetical protein